MRKVLVFLIAVTLLVATSSFAKMGKDAVFPKDWRGFIHAKSMVIPDKSHDLYGFHHIYINKKGLETLKKGGKYPEGTIFIGAFYDVVTEKDGSIHQGKKLFYVYMKKDKSAVDTGGWEYAAFDADGKYMKKDVKKECYGCHAAVKDSDYIFTKFIE